MIEPVILEYRPCGHSEPYDAFELELLEPPMFCLCGTGTIREVYET